MRNSITSIAAISAFFVIAITSALLADAIPAKLPRHDGKPADMTKPVKVYILAGQSNMVGMGDLRGARPLYPSVYLSADPAVIEGRMPVGKSALKKLDVSNVKAAIYNGAYNPKADYSAMQPVATPKVEFGKVSAALPSIAEPHTLVVTATIQVPVDGKYEVRPGYESSSHNVTTLDGKEVYRKDVGGKAKIETVQLEEGRDYAISVTYFKGGSATFWMEQVGIEGRGDLETLVKKDGKYTFLIDKDGKWIERQDVYFQEARVAKEGRGSRLSATSNGRSIGPELGFGYVMGEFHDEQVLLIKTAMGNRSLKFDFRPPSSGRTDPESKWESLEWKLMVEGVNKTLANIDKVVPGYKGQGYEIVGFGWFQGHKDGGATKEEYEKHLVNLIKDVRTEWKNPDMKVVVATVGFGGWRMADKYKGIHAAQMAVGDPKQHPEFAGNVASVDIRNFWRENEESPRPQDYHYNRNAETYFLIGDGMGRAMVEMLGGKAEKRVPKIDRKAKAEKMLAAAANAVQPTDAAKAASFAAIKPLIVDGALKDFMTNSRNAAGLKAIAGGKKPRRANQFLNDVGDSVAEYYALAGINDYSWQDYGPNTKDGEWQYFSFDPNDDKKGDGYRKVKLPAGMENWFTPEFDAAAAGWKTGKAPFGQRGGKLDPLNPGCKLDFCRCSMAPATLWSNEIILLRTTVELPAIEDGYRYRIVVGGSAHVNAGEGYVVYVDGKKVAESTRGVGKREGARPRGGHIYADVLPELKDGKATIAVKSFLRYTHPRIKNYPPSGHISVWLEKQKLPPME